MGQFHNGEYIPLDKFWILKNGKRAGLPMSRCADCLRAERYGEKLSGYIPLRRVHFIFHEMEHRVGRAEAMRRLGVSQNFYIRLDQKENKSIQKAVVKKGMEILREMRAINEVRHKDSIHHGSELRGHKVREVVTRRDYYKSHGDDDTERRRTSTPRP